MVCIIWFITIVSPIGNFVLLPAGLELNLSEGGAIFILQKARPFAYFHWKILWQSLHKAKIRATEEKVSVALCNSTLWAQGLYLWSALSLFLCNSFRNQILCGLPCTTTIIEPDNVTVLWLIDWLNYLFIYVSVFILFLLMYWLIDFYIFICVSVFILLFYWSIDLFCICM